ncbi:GNAT family N-acetyltransferase [Elioraea sp. Yellowstone]|uniref:GNAT family N-acetyltransferase n=1 Tax=Elioraea sp. Yellowstone TaxID=2592070 RepID=UPI001154910A|nr:GNAT family N-acetyltransferase [Elioraea sp. Yellowstone]TQF78156.1 GNAT family N-acetyltransferase [Elioraea sp. Yellowstone]
MTAARVTIEPVRSFEAIGRAWQALEAEAGPIPPFRAWSWVGCLAEERYSDPWLARAEAGGRTVGLALFNRARGRLLLAESGEAARDAPFVEHNGPLVAAGAAPDTAAALLAAAWQARGVRRLRLSGVEPALAQAAGGVALRHRIRPAPFVELDRVRAAGGDPLALLSANARQQLRRTLRHLGAAGPLVLTRAATPAEAAGFLDRLIALHQADWQARGRPGAFADPFMPRFHHVLVARSFAAGGIDLWRLAAGGRELGYLYALTRAGHVCLYQGGFVRAAAADHRPGLAAHVLAIAEAARRGDRIYDFLAGAARYKRSLATASRDLAWVELVRPGSAAAWAARLRRLVQRARQTRVDDIA